jgi:hypothetical protein
MIGLLRTILILGIIYIIFRFLTRHVFPLLLGNYVNHKMSEMEQRQQSYNKKKQRSEGEVTIDYKPKNKKQYSDNSGEYVDFEEIK